MEEQQFDELYIDFWRNELIGDRLEKDVNLITCLAGLKSGDSVLDLGCGFGRISRALTERGMRVVGVERSVKPLQEAIRNQIGDCQFIESDWLDRAWQGDFNCILFWFTTLCAGREADMQAIRVACSSLSKRGVLLIETRHWDRMNRLFEPITERRSGKGLLIENHNYDPITGIQTTTEHYQIGDRSVLRKYEIRRYTFAELREMCLQAGFVQVEGFDEGGGPLTNDSKRAILRAQIE